MGSALQRGDFGLPFFYPEFLLTPHNPAGKISVSSWKDHPWKEIFNNRPSDPQKTGPLVAGPSRRGEFCYEHIDGAMTKHRLTTQKNMIELLFFPDPPNPQGWTWNSDRKRDFLFRVKIGRTGPRYFNPSQTNSLPSCIDSRPLFRNWLFFQVLKSREPFLASPFHGSI